VTGTSRVIPALVVATVALLVGAGPGADPAAAWTEGACPTSSGVTVVIDFQQLGGGIWIRCAPGSPATGLQALNDAGVAWTPTIRFPDFVCRIDGRPTAAVEPCANTPPATRYWSYWTAPRGGTWTYSNQGGRRTPVAGSVEGWSFSQTADGQLSPPPRIPPPAPPTSRPTDPPPTTPQRPAPSLPRATTPPTPSSMPGAGPTPAPDAPSVAPATTIAAADGSTADGSSASDSSTAATGSVPPTAVPTDGTSSTGGASDGSRSSTDGTVTGADGEEIALNAPGNRTPVDAGSPVGTVAALAIVAALVATSIVIRRRRIGIDLGSAGEP